MRAILVFILLCGALVAEEIFPSDENEYQLGNVDWLCSTNDEQNIVVIIEDSIKTTHYYNGETPPEGTVGKMIEYYDGCNIHRMMGINACSSTLRHCEFTDGTIIRTWEKYIITEKEYAVIHDSYIYSDPYIKRW